MTTLNRWTADSAPQHTFAMRTLDPRSQSNTRALRVASCIIGELFGPPGDRHFGVRYWNGLDEPARDNHVARFTLVLCWPGALRQMLLPPTEIRLVEAFLHHDFDIEGDLEAAAAIAVPLAERLRSPRRLLRLARLLLQLPRRRDGATDAHRSVVDRYFGRLRNRFSHGRQHAKARDARAIKHHYDVGNDFYALWLGNHRAYSCAYFKTGNEDLEQAQEAKFDLICRKLRLRPGDSLLDIGCGWGGLIKYAVRHYGIRATGITLSEAQATLAREQIASEGLADQCSVEVSDYRDLSVELRFDKVVSVGMFEHVGRAQLDTYFASAMRLLRPGGLFLNHGIISLEDARRGSAAAARRFWGKGQFIDRYVFPDGDVVPLAVAIAAGEGAGFETRDVESLREHYAETLRHWVRRLELHSTEARALVGEPTFRVWHLYLAASAHAFQAARVGVVQMLFAKPTRDGDCDHARTRADLYL